MMCDSPAIEADESKLDADHPMELEYGFIMDDVTGVQNLTTSKGFAHFLLYPNPIFKPFDREVKYYKSDYLNINVSFKIKIIKLFFPKYLKNPIYQKKLKTHRVKK